MLKMRIYTEGVDREILKHLGRIQISKNLFCYNFVTGRNCMTLKNNLTNIIYKNRVPIENINHQFDLVETN